VVGSFVEAAGPPFHVDPAVDLRSATVSHLIAANWLCGGGCCFNTHNDPAGYVPDISPRTGVVSDL
jgi:hypothetical protein